MKKNNAFITVMLDPDFIDFLDYMKETKGSVKARLIALSVTSEYKEKYEQFLKKKGNENK